VKNSGFSPNPVILQEVTYHVRASPDQSEQYKKTIQNTISKIEDKTPLREIDDIVDMVKTDCEVVLDRGRHGVTISEILAELWSNNNCGMSRTTSEEISKAIGWKIKEQSRQHYTW